MYIEYLSRGKNPHKNIKYNKKNNVWNQLQIIRILYIYIIISCNSYNSYLYSLHTYMITKCIYILFLIIGIM